MLGYEAGSNEDQLHPLGIALLYMSVYVDSRNVPVEVGVRIRELTFRDA